MKVAPRPKQVAKSHQPNKSIGAHLGSSIGSWAEKGLRSLFGTGDYSAEHKQAGGFDVSENSIVKPLSSSAVPLLNSINLKDGHIRVKHREFLGDLVTGTNIIQRYDYALNPSSDRTFPWLSTIAQNFEQWIPHGIVFELVSTCGNAVSSTNASLGTFSMATTYNFYSPPAVNKVELLNSYFATSGKTADNLMHAVECAPEEVQTRIFNTYDNVSTPSAFGDQRFYFLGYTSIIASGSQASYTGCELWVTYDISLIKPRKSRLGLVPAVTVLDLLEEDKRVTLARLEDKPSEEKYECVEIAPTSDPHTQAFLQAFERIRLSKAV